MITQPSLLDALAECLDIKDTKPVSFSEFCTSPDYCDDSNIYQYWLDHGDNIPESVSEILLVGSLGGGKSTFASYYMAYFIYTLFFQGSPQRYLGMSENTDLYVLYFSVNMTQAMRSGFQMLYSIITHCKWFKNNCPINEEKRTSIEFVDRHFYIEFASNFQHQIGLNVVGSILDEANFRGSNGVGAGTEEQYAEVKELYAQLQDRALSRFARPDGSVRALMILISSASYQSSFSEQRIAIVKNSPHARIIVSRAYDVKPHLFSKERFTVFKGCGNAEPCIITDDDHKMRILRNAGILGTGEEDDFFVEVPENLRPAFEQNIVLALQNHAGVPTNMSSSFMSNMRYLYESYTDEIQPVFTSFQLEASTGDDTELMEHFLPNNVEFADRPHSLFLDLSLAHDCCALCMHRYDGKDEKGQDIHTRVFLLEIKPPKFPHNTKISKVQRLIIALAQVYNLVAFASDQYQSSQLRQEVCDELGLENVRVSIDSTDIPHILWQRALVEGRIKQSYSKQLEVEVNEAIHDLKRRRVVKATKGSDDVLQACIGSFYLSDTVGKEGGTITGLYDGPHNFTSANAFARMYKKLGYEQV